jgi:hypothetical protein
VWGRRGAPEIDRRAGDLDGGSVPPTSRDDAVLYGAISLCGSIAVR